MKVSVVIPAHNRPALLQDAVASVMAQTHHDWQLVIVDDGSQPPVDAGSLAAAANIDSVLVRHEVAQGVARAKNAGVRAATGEIVTILDDDDLLAPTALETICRAFADHPQLDCLFLGVEPFGPYAAGVAESRRTAMARFVEGATRADNGLCFFDERLFPALVQSVPIDFQRPAARKGAWNIVGGFDESGLFSESAWAIRASAACHVALALAPLSRWRIHDSNFGWDSGAEGAANQLRQAEDTQASATVLVQHFRHERAKVLAQLKLLESGLADNYFNKAYLLRHERSRDGMNALLNSMRLRPRLKHVKLMLRYGLGAASRRLSHALERRTDRR